MTDYEYEIIPHKDIRDLKEELNRLKGIPERASRSLNNSVDELNKKIERLLELFNEASREIDIEKDEESQIIKRVSKIENKLDVISEQNEKIAEAILSLLELMDNGKPKPIEQKPFAPDMPRFESNPFASPPPRPQAPTFGAGIPPQGPPAQPMPSFSTRPSAPPLDDPFDDIPPPPVSPGQMRPEKKGLFSKLK